MTNGRQSEPGCVWLHHLRAVSDAGGRSTAADSAARHATMQTADSVAFLSTERASSICLRLARSVVVSTRFALRPLSLYRWRRGGVAQW